MAYKIKEIYYTLQGEGANAGRPAIFCRFSGCNLWSGREVDRANAVCKFCDTDFWGTDGIQGGKYFARDLALACKNLWPEHSGVLPYVVFTGGEPALQLDKKLIDEFHKFGFIIAVETNGTLELPDNIDWICVSPKANTEIVVNQGNEIKVVFPQIGIDPKDFENLQFEHRFLQPMDGTSLKENTIQAVTYCKSNPIWKLSIQSHKYINIP